MMEVLYKCIDCKNPYSQRSTILILTLTLLRSDPELLYATGLDNHVTHAGAAGSCCVNACIARSTTSRFPKPDRPAASITGTRIEWELKEEGEKLNQACTFRRDGIDVLKTRVILLRSLDLADKRKWNATQTYQQFKWVLVVTGTSTRLLKGRSLKIIIASLLLNFVWIGQTT